MLNRMAANDERTSRRERRMLGCALYGTILFILGLVALVVWALFEAGS